MHMHSRSLDFKKSVVRPQILKLVDLGKIGWTSEPTLKLKYRHYSYLPEREKEQKLEPKIYA